MPIESALSLAISNNWELQRLAMQHQIGFVTPINLIAILRMAENLWRLDAQNENAEAIATKCLSLPIYPELESTDIKYIANLINKF